MLLHQICCRQILGKANFLGDANALGDVNALGYINVLGYVNVLGKDNFLGDANALGDVNALGYINVLGYVTVLGETNVPGYVNTLVEGNILVEDNILAHNNLFRKFSLAVRIAYCESFIFNCSFHRSYSITELGTDLFKFELQVYNLCGDGGEVGVWCGCKECMMNVKAVWREYMKSM